MTEREQHEERLTSWLRESVPDVEDGGFSAGVMQRIAWRRRLRLVIPGTGALLGLSLAVPATTALMRESDRLSSWLNAPVISVEGLMSSSGEGLVLMALAAGLLTLLWTLAIEG